MQDYIDLVLYKPKKRVTRLRMAYILALSWSRSYLERRLEKEYDYPDIVRQEMPAFKFDRGLVCSLDAIHYKY